MNIILVPMKELTGTISEVRKQAHEMVDKCIDEYEELTLRQAPEGTIKVWGERE